MLFYFCIKDDHRRETKFIERLNEHLNPSRARALIMLPLVAEAYRLTGYHGVLYHGKPSSSTSHDLLLTVEVALVTYVLLHG